MIFSMTNSAGFWWQRAYEQNRDLISAVSNHVNHVNPVLISAYDYANDAAGRRVSRNDDSFGYNARSEVIGAVIGTNDYGYAYDAIGNRIVTTENTKTTEYLANELNQYTQISVPSVSSVVNPTYDADGNMTRLGDWRHTWDAENRLVRSEPSGFATNGAIMVDNRYDYRHRRYSKTVRRLSGRGASYPFDPSQPGTWDVVETRTFIYDGWNLIAEVVVDAQTGATNVTRYLWGPDVSGTLQGAGGVGGLLAVIRPDGTFFPCYDANGNITDYIDASGATVAHREYGPFGETRTASGPMADAFSFWFSTKYLDHETGFYYYGYRFYSPELMRWLNRDPIEEDGGDNGYGFTENNPVTNFDVLGLVKGEVKHRPWWTPEVVDAAVSGFGEIRAFLSENECKCKCVNNIYKLDCRLSINYTIRIAPKDSPKWEKSVPASYPTYPVPDDYITWSLAKKRKFVENHERKHLAALKAWWTRRIEQLKGLETLQFSSGECENQQERAVRENEKQFRACYNDEVNHKHW